MAVKRKTKRLNAGAFMGESARIIQISLGGTKDAVAQASFARNPQCDKDPHSVFLSNHCQVQPGKRRPPVRKIELVN